MQPNPIKELKFDDLKRSNQQLKNTLSSIAYIIGLRNLESHKVPPTERSGADMEILLQREAGANQAFKEILSLTKEALKKA